MDIRLGTNRSGIVVFTDAVLTLVDVFFLDFPAAGLGLVMDLGSGFLFLSVFLVVVTFCCFRVSVTRWRKGF